METKRKRTKVVVSLLALAGLAAFSLFAVGGSLEPSAPPAPTMKTLDEVEPRIPIHASDLPLTITEPNSYYLAEDIDFTDTLNDAITIECNDVTIDLMGYTLKGPDSGTKAGIYMNGCANVEVRNGTVRDFYRGIHEDSFSGGQHRVINVRAMSNEDYGIRLYAYGHVVKGCTAAENSSTGIYVSAGCVVTGNTVYDNANYGIGTSYGCTVTGNTAYDNGGNGISVGAGSTVVNNSAQKNGSNGIVTADGSTVTGNSAYDNDSVGIDAGHGSTVTGNTTKSNTGDGIRVGCCCIISGNTCVANGSGGDGAGIYVTGSHNRIEGNHVGAYNDRGIDVDDSGNIIIKNTASNNTTDYDIAADNSYGPIVDVTSAGDISSDPNAAHPWANFKY
jgi:parallel beta-helix repeat protein